MVFDVGAAADDLTLARSLPAVQDVVKLAPECVVFSLDDFRQLVLLDSLKKRSARRGKGRNLLGVDAPLNLNVDAREPDSFPWIIRVVSDHIADTDDFFLMPNRPVDADVTPIMRIVPHP